MVRGGGGGGHRLDRYQVRETYELYVGAGLGNEEIVLLIVIINIYVYMYHI